MSKHIKPNIYYTYEAGGHKYAVMITHEGKLVVSTKGRVGKGGWFDGVWSMVTIWHSEETWFDRARLFVVNRVPFLRLAA